MEMKIFIVETTLDEEWEMNTGFHLVKAISKSDILNNHNLLRGQRIVSVMSVEEALKINSVTIGNVTLKTLLDPQSM